ncbi:MAG TPA: amidohydrolase family protein [Myxococcales bacterium]|nr:amidohydrolase family protein [Myxococcales bacterium]
MSSAAALLLAGVAVATRLARASTFQTITVTAGTDLAAAVSPADGHIVMDLQGVLWSLPKSGGATQRLTEDFLEPARPDFSPDGKLVAFQAYKGGTFHIWVMNADGSGARQLTSGHGDDREPRFSPDGTKIAFSSDRAFNGTYEIFVTDLSGNLQQWTNTPATSSATIDEFEPTWSRDGMEIAYVIGTGVWSKSAAGAPHQIVANTNQTVHSPAYSPSGNQIAWMQSASNKSRLVVRNLTTGATTEYTTPRNDVFPFYPQWLSEGAVLYTADGQIQTTDLSTGQTAQALSFSASFNANRPSYDRKKFDFDSRKKQQAVGIVGPALSPDGTRVAFEALNQIWVMRIGEVPRAITSDTYYKTDVAWSHDGTRLAYSTDRAGTMDVWIHDFRTGAETNVTNNPNEAEVSAAWSPDDRSIAFQDHAGVTWTVDLATGTTKPVGPVNAQGRPTLVLFAPSKPSWHASGKTIAIGALKPYTRRFREGTSQILTVDVSSAAMTYTEPEPFESLSTRGEDGPVYSPDGKWVAFGMRSVLFVRSVDANGLPTGPAQQITSEPSDAPTWSGDSQSILYLSNGQLRLINRDGSNARTIPVDLTWRAEQATGLTLIHAARLWDGRGPQVQTNVDIVVAGNRIRSIQSHKDSAHKGAIANNGHVVVTTAAQTVLPGLWESHTHEWIEGKFYGDKLGRLWLAYGVTTLNSVGDPAYRAVETRESFTSGSRTGPRYFATGEAVDGERVFYNFMRPVTRHDQLALEVSRAAALGYDMVKTYVRLQHDWQAEVAQTVHDRMGVWTASHYMLPGLAHNMDGQTHVSATTRTGFAYTRSGSGISYSDMTSLFGQSGMFDISTTFNSSLYAEDPGMVDDLRLAVLNPSWDQAGLLAKRNSAVSTDQTVSLDSLAKEEATVSAIIRGGSIALAGTDSPLDNVATALHLNLRAQEKFGGRENWNVLQTATYLPAKAFGLLDDLGSLEAGKLADLIVVDGDPLAHVKDLANVKLTMKNGRVYTIDELEAPFAASRSPVSPALSAPKHGRDAKYWWHDPDQMIEDDHK